ncbi:MAG: type II CAAX endopeptidase family protein [Bryobacteraceae bacterium]
MTPELTPLPPPSEPDPVFWGWLDVALFLGAVLPSLLIAGYLTRGLLKLIGAKPMGAVSLLVAQFVAYALLFLALYGVLKLKYGRPFWSSLGLTSIPKAVLRRAILIGPLLAIAVSLGGIVLQTPETENPMMKLLQDRSSIVVVGVFAVTFGPLAEELIFRGFLQPLLQRTFGIIGGIFCACVVFALLHGPEYGWTWQHVVLLTLASAVFGWTRYRTGSTTPAVLMHSVYNFTIFTAFLIGKDLPGQ